MLEQLQDKEERIIVKDQQLEELIPEELLEQEINEAERIRENIAASKVKVKRRITKFPPRRRRSTGEESASQVTAKLPLVVIPKFTGDPTQWRSFWDQFRAAIHEKEEIGNVTKFVYLKSYMDGAALNALAGLSLIEDNYEVAVGLLEKRFGRRDVAINCHMNRITSLNPVKRSSDIVALRTLYDTCDAQVKGLEALGVPTANYGYMFCHLVIKLLPQDIALDYSRKLGALDEYDVEILMEHLRQEVECRERAILLNRPSRGAEEAVTDYHYDSRVNRKAEQYISRFSHPAPRNRKPTTAALNVTVSGSEACCYCKATSHQLEDCKSVPLQQKMEILSQQDRCFLCLRVRHTARRCKSKKKCEKCQRRHHKSICREIYGEKSGIPDENANPPNEDRTAVSVAAVIPQGKAYEQDVFLQNIVVYAEGSGRKIPIRCLLDNGAQRSFITKDLVDALDLPVIGQGSIHVGGFESDKPRTSIRRKVEIVLSHINDPESRFTLTGFESQRILGAVVNMPGEELREKMLQKGIGLADIAEVKGERVPKELSMLIAADYYWTIVTGRIHRLTDSFVALESRFGWTSNVFTLAVVAMNVTTEVEDEITTSLKTFWELEALVIKEESPLSKTDEEIIREHDATIRFQNGRYEVKLPWRENREELGDNLKLASKRLYGLVKKLVQNPVLYQRYQDTFQDYLSQEIIERVPSQAIDSDDPKYYIPHFPVIREEKETMKFRVVHDAAAHERGRPSLNCLLHAGPNLNPDLLSTLMRFREGEIAITADIEKAFLMIALAPEDTDFTRFLWIKTLPRKDEEVEIVHIRMRRVLFGVSSSPFLLTATLRHHLSR